MVMAMLVNGLGATPGRTRYVFFLLEALYGAPVVLVLVAVDMVRFIAGKLGLVEWTVPGTGSAGTWVCTRVKVHFTGASCVA